MVSDLIQLQNLTKKDPDGYKDEFLLQLRHYQTQLELFKLTPNVESREFRNLVHYLSHVHNNP